MSVSASRKRANRSLKSGQSIAGRRHLVERLAGADAEDHAAREHRAERAESLRDDRGMIAERRRQHAGAHQHARRRRAERAEPGERGRRVAAGVLPGLEMVADEDGVEAELLRQHGEIEELARARIARPMPCSRAGSMSMLS